MSTTKTENWFPQIKIVFKKVQVVLDIKNLDFVNFLQLCTMLIYITEYIFFFNYVDFVKKLSIIVSLQKKLNNWCYHNKDNWWKFYLSDTELRMMLYSQIAMAFKTISCYSVTLLCISKLNRSSQCCNPTRLLPWSISFRFCTQQNIVVLLYFS